MLSSAGWRETMRMCDAEPAEAPPPGQLSFVESVSVLDTEPRELGCDRTIVFFNDSDKFHWRKPDELVDVRSGVICCPNNFAYDEPLAEGIVRITALANFDRWRGLPDEAYQAAKRLWHEKMAASAVRFVGDFRPRVVATDTFTPTTIRRFTGHENGAVYGAPEKRWSGTTHLKNLFICGTDQGFVGIIGAMFSGIAMANRHLLAARGDGPDPLPATRAPSASRGRLGHFLSSGTPPFPSPRSTSHNPVSRPASERCPKIFSKARATATT